MTPDFESVVCRRPLVADVVAEESLSSPRRRRARGGPRKSDPKTCFLKEFFCEIVSNCGEDGDESVGRRTSLPATVGRRWQVHVSAGNRQQNPSREEDSQFHPFDLGPMAIAFLACSGGTASAEPMALWLERRQSSDEKLEP